MMTSPLTSPNYFKQKRFVAYLTAGMGNDVAMAKALVDGGVDILEVGVPFSDPILDGPVIASAMQRALAKGTTLVDVLATCRAIKAATHIPIVLFSYYNPIFVHGDSFYEQAVAAGVDAVLIVDLPLSEQQQHLQRCGEVNLASVQIIAPNTPMRRVQAAAKTQPAFLYYACRGGTTGVQAQLPEGLSTTITAIREHTSLPLVVGFGISTTAMARACCKLSDGFVVGSYLVDAILHGESAASLKQMATGLASGKWVD